MYILYIQQEEENVKKICHTEQPKRLCRPTCDARRAVPKDTAAQ